MTDILFNGSISVPTGQDETLIEDFNKFLAAHNVQFRGIVRITEFDDVEIIEDIEGESN